MVITNKKQRLITASKPIIIMNNIIRPLILFLCVVAILSCSKKDDEPTEVPQKTERPFVDFAITPGDDPLTFVFDNKSTNYKTLEWRFGDDSLSNEVSPTHVYARPGTYEANLTAISEDGSTARKLLVIKIIADSVANFVAIRTGLQNTVQFSATSKTSIKSLAWDFGDNTTSTDLSPTKTYPADFFKDAKVTITTEKGSQIELTRKMTSKGSLVDITDRYLLNTGPGFRAAQQVGRWGVVADWTVNDAVKQRGSGMGSWDSFNGGQFLSMESWGGETHIKDGKIYQTMNLPAGAYFYNAVYNDYTVNDFGKSYMVMAQGDSLPNVNDVETKSLGFYKLKGSAPNDLVVSMEIAAPSTVSLGLACTMEANNQTIKCRQIRLYRAND